MLDPDDCCDTCGIGFRLPSGRCDNCDSVIVKTKEHKLDQQQEHILQFFAYSHLPPHLQDVSRPFSELAGSIMELPRNPERTVALRKLLEAKDAAVRAKLAIGEVIAARPVT